MKKIYLLILYCLVNSAANCQYSWIVKDPLPATPRLFNRGFMVNGSGYVVGGVTNLSPFTVIKDVWHYNPSADSWLQKSDFPSNTSSGSVFVINDTAYYIGGSSASGVYINTSYYYNVSSDTWTPIASFPESSVAEAFSFVINDIGYVGAGVRAGGAISNTTCSYNPQTNHWSSVANYPGTLNLNVTGFSIGQYGYAGLGQDGQGNFTNQFYKYDPGSNLWTAIAPFPGKARSGAMSFVLGGKAYVGGGVRTIGGTPYGLGDFYQYDPASNTWAAVSGLPGEPRYNAASFASGNEAYVVGGYDDDGVNYYNLVSEFANCNTITGLMPMPGNSGKSGVELYPNPSTNEISVNANNFVSGQLVYKIASVDGKIIQTGNSSQSKFKFNVNSIANGVYILNISIDGIDQAATKFEVIH